ncbi:hypothetical protein LCGC14_2916880, partial [marine sediment metagenome]
YVAFREYGPGGGYSNVQHINDFGNITAGYTVEQSVGGNITTEEQIRQLYTRDGWTIIAPPVTRVNAQVDNVRGMMELNKLYIFEDLFTLLGQINNCMWILGEDNQTTNKIKNEGQYHLLACLRYLGGWLPVVGIPSKEETDKVTVGVW